MCVLSLLFNYLKTRKTCGKGVRDTKSAPVSFLTTFVRNILLPHKCVRLASYTRGAGTNAFLSSCQAALTIVRLKPNENVRGMTFSQY